MIQKYKKSENFIWQEEKEKIIFCDIKTGEFFEGNDIGKMVFKYLDEYPIDEIIKKVSETFTSVNFITIKTDVEDFVEELKNKGIITQICQ